VLGKSIILAWSHLLCNGRWQQCYYCKSTLVFRFSLKKWKLDAFCIWVGSECDGRYTDHVHCPVQFMLMWTGLRRCRSTNLRVVFYTVHSTRAGSWQRLPPTLGFRFLPCYDAEGTSTERGATGVNAPSPHRILRDLSSVISCRSLYLASCLLFLATSFSCCKFVMLAFLQYIRGRCNTCIINFISNEKKRHWRPVTLFFTVQAVGEKVSCRASVCDCRMNELVCNLVIAFCDGCGSF